MKRGGLPVLHFRPNLGETSAGHEFVTVVGFVGNNRIVYVRRKQGGRTWEFPGGRRKADEAIVQAGEREFYEETSLQLDCVVKVAEIRNERPDGSQHSRVWLITGLVVEPKIDSRPKDPEVTACRAMTEIPDDSTFHRDWISLLIKLSQERLEKTINKKMWSAAAESYDNATWISKKDVHYGPLIPGEDQLRLLPNVRGARVLELGCGAGHNLLALQAKGASGGLGIDFSPKQILRARRRLRNGKFEVKLAEITELDFCGEALFDIGLSIFSICFVSNPATLLSNVSKVMRPGGIVVISTDHPNRIGTWHGDHLRIYDWYASRTRLRKWSITEENLMLYFHHVHDLPTLVDALTLNGFLIEKILEPQALPKNRIKEAPYRSSYFIKRYTELRRIPYTLIIKARRIKGIA